jgi:hypothetical protein
MNVSLDKNGTNDNKKVTVHMISFDAPDEYYMLFWFWSDICGYITCLDFISPEPLDEGDILSWQVIYPHISIQNKKNNFITLPLSNLDDFKINHCYFK